MKKQFLSLFLIPCLAFPTGSLAEACCPHHATPAASTPSCPFTVPSAAMALLRENPSDPMVVWCTLPGLATLTRTIAGDRVRVHSLLTGAQSPCTYSPTPRAVSAMRGADLLITVGLPFEHRLAARLKAMNNSLIAIDASTGIHADGDPHVWMSIPALISIASSIGEVLSALDPDHHDLFRKNLDALQQELAHRHEKLAHLLHPFAGTSFFVHHPVLGHFAADYGLVQRAIEIDGKSPSPKQLERLISQARSEQVRVIFVQPQFSNRPARILAERIQGRVDTVNPLAEEIPAALEQVAEQIVHAYAQ